MSIATVDTPTQALVKFRDALPLYRRVWVNDQDGIDVSLDELFARSLGEQSTPWRERS